MRTTSDRARSGRRGNLRAILAGAGAAALLMASGAGARAATVVVGAQDDLYNAGGGGFDGLAPQAVNVAGLSSITFSVSTGATVTVNGGTYNDADGGGSVQGELNTGGNSISGITAPTAGFIAGVFEGATLGATPAALSFVSGGTPGTVGFSSLSPSLQQAFFIGDGLTGDGTGATQTFYIPTGATTLYLGLTDACGYSGSPSCFGDNFGSFTVTTSGAAMSGGVPEPATWAMMLGGFGGLGAAMRSRRKSAAATI